MIVGTAGHIDHGKTTLVRALTGIDTDRLKEEKARGISIELGYAYLPLPGGGVLGFVDVPGHERFVHTMVAGATGIDMALLVVAADDGVMPQTREHLAILELLGVARAAVALTKADRVDATQLEAVRAQVAALLAGTPLREAPLFTCNATDPGDAGVQALSAHLRDAAREPAHSRGDAEFFRLPVDRVFSLPGHGTVVAGPVQGGRVAAGDALLHMPQGAPVRVRALHVQNRPGDAATTGQRAALNLAGTPRESLQRGDWIADARAFAPARQVDARLRWLPGARIALRDGLRVHVHWGAGHRIARVLLLEPVAGARGTLVQLVFEAPVCAMTGDRFIVRDENATATVGGGTMLDPEAPRRRRRTPERLAWLAAIEHVLASGDIAPMLEASAQGIADEVLARRMRRPRESLELPTDAVQVAGYVIAARHWETIAARFEDRLAQWHAQHPDEPGLDGGRLQRLALPALAADLARARLQASKAQGRLHRHGAWWHLPTHDLRASPREAALLARLLPQLESGGFDPPWVRTLAAASGIEEAQVRGALRRAAARGEAWQVVPDLFYHPRRIAELAGIVDALAREYGAAEAAAFRDALGIGRKRAIQLLEFFDRAGYTRRVGAGHRPRAESRWGEASIG